jgi:formate dehydrogenase subunit gamma
VRFDPTERLLHWANAALFGVLLVSGAALYAGPLAAVVGRRALLKEVHVIAGLLLPVPLLGVVVARRWSRALRADVARLARWDPADWRWLRSRGRDPGVPLGKFNAGQKLNAAWTVGTVLVMLLTGAVMRWFAPFPDDWRTGATFVHDVGFLLAAVVVTGHVAVALTDRHALRAMVRGWVPAEWARRRRPGWFAEAAASTRPRESGTGTGPSPSGS